MNLYPKGYKESFNCLLKIGGQKGTSKKMHELLTIMAKIITDSYNEEVKKVKDIFQEDFVIPLDYSSAHNVVKD